MHSLERVTDLSLGWPHREGWHEPERNLDGTLKGRIDPTDTKRREEKHKTNMVRYQERTKLAQEKLLNAAAGIKEEHETPVPRSELDLVVMGILADPGGALDGKGSANLRTLTDDQRRARARVRMDEQAAEARKDLDTVLKGETEEREPYEGLSDAQADALLDEIEDELDAEFDAELDQFVNDNEAETE